MNPLAPLMNKAMEDAMARFAGGCAARLADVGGGCSLKSRATPIPGHPEPGRPVANDNFKVTK